MILHIALISENKEGKMSTVHRTQSPLFTTTNHQTTRRRTIEMKRSTRQTEIITSGQRLSWNGLFKVNHPCDISCVTFIRLLLL